MSSFFDAGGRTGWINLGHVVRIQQRWSRTDRETTTVFEMTDGTMHETIQHIDPRAWSSRFVAAAPGTFCIGVFAHAGDTEDTDARPTECHACHEPVIAWAIPPDDDDNRWPTPVLLEPPAGNVEIFHPLPDGKYRSIANCDYDSLDDAKQTVLARAQADWDREHAQQRESANAPA